MRRALVVVGVTAVVVSGLAMVMLFPTRTFLGQERALDATERRLEVLTEQNAELATRVDRLNTDAEVERLAREQYRLVKPGEEAYAILPAPTTTTTAPPVAGQRPGRPARQAERSWLDGALDTLTFWD